MERDGQHLEQQRSWVCLWSHLRMEHVPIRLLHLRVTQPNTRQSPIQLPCLSSPPPLYHTKSHAGPSPHAGLPSPAQSLERFFGVLSQKHGPCIGGIPAGFSARPPSHLRACWARSQSFPHPPPVLIGHPRQQMAAIPVVPRGRQRRLQFGVHICS